MDSCKEMLSKLQIVRNNLLSGLGSLKLILMTVGDDWGGFVGGWVVGCVCQASLCKHQFVRTARDVTLIGTNETRWIAPKCIQSRCGSRARPHPIHRNSCQSHSFDTHLWAIEPKYRRKANHFQINRNFMATSLSEIVDSTDGRQGNGNGGSLFVLSFPISLFSYYFTVYAILPVFMTKHIYLSIIQTNKPQNARPWVLFEWKLNRFGKISTGCCGWDRGVSSHIEWHSVLMCELFSKHLQILCLWIVADWQLIRLFERDEVKVTSWNSARLKYESLSSPLSSPSMFDVTLVASTKHIEFQQAKCMTFEFRYNSYTSRVFVTTTGLWWRCWMNTKHISPWSERIRWKHSANETNPSRQWPSHWCMSSGGGHVMVL